ncbi:MAG: hypothetical protein WDN45_10220 [Caulobacteraceae bacterium]
MKRALVLALCLAFAGAAAQAQPAATSATGQPDSQDWPTQTYVVAGYKTARFGMTPAEVAAAAAKDLPGAKITAPVANPINRTSVMVARTDRLAPGPGPAIVSYVFGAAGGRLIHVNVDWTMDQPSPADREALIDAGSRATREFVGYQWKLFTVARGVPVGPNSLILFAGTGEAGGAVEVRLEGVPYTAKTKAGATVASPPATGRATLHIAIAQADAKPDTYTIKPGEF